MKKEFSMEQLINGVWEAYKLNPKIFGIILKTSRRYKNLTQSEIARKIGISSSTISKYENGKRFPSKKTLRELIKYL